MAVLGRKVGPPVQLWLSARFIIPGLALGWCVMFPIIGMLGRFYLFGDGALFAYAVAADDGWAFHWRQISGRVAAFAYAALPGQVWGRISGDPSDGVTLYAALFFLAPAVGLAVTWCADRTGVVRLWAALSIVLLCPFVFGFPTELWVTHAAIWPALALAWSPGRFIRWAWGTVALAIVVLSHEGGVIWACILLGALALSPGRAHAVPRAALGLGLTIAIWIACKVLIPPDHYVAEVLGRNAWNLVTPATLISPLMLSMVAGLCVYIGALRLRGGPWIATGVAAIALSLWWIFRDPMLHAWGRYYLRTVMLGGVPVLMVLASLHAGGHVPKLRCSVARAMPTALGAILLVTLVHAAATVTFAMAWRGYIEEVRRVSDGVDIDPVLGDPDFVSAARIPARFTKLSWNSTTPFLSIMVSDGYAPRHLLVDPSAGYFWFDCATATANAMATRNIPRATRDMVQRYACLHRQTR